MTSQKIRLAFFLLISTGASASAQPPAVSTGAVRAGWTLADVYSAALRNSERIAVSEARLREAEFLAREIYGTAFPEFFFDHRTTWQDQSGVGSGSSGSNSGSTQSPQNEGAFRLRRNGFTGYRELAALKAGKSAVHQREWEKRRAEQLLLEDLAAAYYGVLEADESRASTQNLIGVTEDRLKELRRRVRVGRTREAEAVGSEYQITQLRAQLEESSRAVASRLDLLGFLAGESVTALSAPAARVLDIPALDDYLPRLARRPDVRAAEEAVNVASAAVRTARAGFFPSLDVGAAYYTNRTGFRKPINWDATLGVEIPIFSWGATRAGVNAAQAVLAQREQELKAARRQADLDIRNAHRDLLSARRQLEFREKAASLARRDYDLQVRDDRRGLVTSLEVLESLDRLNAAELSVNSARLRARLAALSLELSTGAEPEEVVK